jgi:putative DNA methylase
VGGGVVRAVRVGEGEYGLAETLSKAKNTSVQAMAEAGLVKAGRGKVRLLRPAELRGDWPPEAPGAVGTAWETAHQVIRVLEAEGEERAAAALRQMGPRAEVARELAYRLFALCERKKRAADALAYNALVQSWPEMLRLAQTQPAPAPAQAALGYGQ